MLIQELDATSAPEWDAYIERHPGSTCYHDRAWQKVAWRAYRLPTRFLLARERAGGRVIGALPLFRVKGMVRTHLTNGLFGAYASVLADDPGTRAALIGHARRLLAEQGLSYLLLKTLDDLAPEDSVGFERVSQWVIATLKLDSDPGRMWDSFRNKIRNCIRKAQSHGLEIRWGRENLRHFYDVLAENMHLKGAPIYGFEFMRDLVDAFGDRARVLTLWKDERAVSGAIALQHRRTVTVPFASSLPSSLSLCPNNLLYWEIIRRGSAEGMELLDFGRSITGSGSLAFKLGWGARTRPQPCYIHAMRGNSEDLNPGRQGVAWFVNRWKRLPRPVANALGPVVCKQIAGLL